MTGRSALLGIILAFVRAWPWRFVGGVALVAGALAMGAGLLAASGTLIAGSALAGLGLLVFNSFEPGSIVRALAVGRTLARYAERLATHDATLRFLADLRVDTFRRLLAGHRDSDRPSLLFNRLTGDLDALDGIVIRLAVPFVAALFVLAGTGLVLAYVSPVLALGIVLPLAVGGIAAPLALAATGRRWTRLKQVALDAARLRSVDLDRRRAALGASARLGGAAASVTDAFDRSADAERRIARLDFAIRLAAGVGQQAALAAAVILGAGLHGDGGLTAMGYAAVILFTLALGETVAPFRALATEEGRWSLAARRLAAIAGERAVAIVRPATADLARLDGVTVREAGAAVDRLAGVTLALPAGRRIALTGPSGGGKSSLIGLLAGTLQPAAGTVSLPDGVRIAWLGQRTELFRGSVAENLRLARPDASDDDLAAALAAVELTATLGTDGLQRRLGDGGSGLSGGERRRLALARTLLVPADLYLLDEPTEGLDGETAARIFAVILARTAGATLVYATHRPSEAAAADHVLQIRDGRVDAIEDIPA